MNTWRLAILLGAGALLVAAPTGEAAGARGARPHFEHVHALAFDASGRVMWLGAHTGLYRSENGGRTWEQASLPAGPHHGHDVMAIAAHPTDAARVYIATHDAGVLVTADAGKTWTAANAGLGGMDVHGLAVDPNVPDKLHALVRDKGAGLYRSTDAGGTWVRVDDGPAGETKALVSVNLASGMGGIFLYAATADGLHRSPDCF